MLPPEPARLPVLNPLRSVRNLSHLVVALASDRRGETTVKPFPKVVFQTPNGETKTPDRQRVPYLRLVRALWLRRWQHDNPDGQDELHAAFRVVHDSVQRARLLESELLDLLRPREL